ncbi:MAG: glycosyl hydrolase, partial [Bacteroidota bacterium]
MSRFLPVLLFLLLLSLENFAQQAEEIIASLPFRNTGPAYMSGRIADIEKDPHNPSTWYVAVASGNVWKTTNRGSTWDPIFETYGSFSTGCIAINPQNPQVLWLGTGENQSQRSVSWGDGVYKSLDGGKSWAHMGLESSEHIGKVLIHPENPDIVYVAAQGPLWKDGGDRGLYKTSDGGKSWKKVLTISPYTGISDLCMDPQNPQILYAASYQRRRHVGILVAGGEESRIFKSTDGGESWKKLSRGLPGGELGRIAIAVSPQKPAVVYALIAGSEPDQSGFYRSENYGESWTKKNDYIVVDPQYYGEIFTDPHQFDHVYAVDVIIRHTQDGGESFERLNTRYKHVDNHDIVFDPEDPDYLMVGCDGGIYESWDRGDHWTYHSNLPIMQFYRVGLDNARPFYNVYGGTQDNSTLFAPSRTTSRHGITNADWKLALGGDGFQARIDPNDPNIAYCQSQYAGIVRYDKRTGQRLDIQPQPEVGDEPLRWHWDSPLLISHYNPKRLYFAAQRIFRSDDRGDSWQAVSEDLSRGEDRNQRKVMGKIYSPEAVWKNVFTSPYGTIVALSESPLDSGILVAGTDDGLLQITEDGGRTWQKVERVPGIPSKSYVADVFCSQHDKNVIYAVFNNHKEGDFTPYLATSKNLGASWKVITQGISAPH